MAIRKIMIEEMVADMKPNVPLLPAPSFKELQSIYDTETDPARRIARMIANIRAHVELDVRMSLGLVKTGGPPVPAWVQIPEPLPAFGTPELAQTVVTMFVRRSIVEDYRKLRAGVLVIISMLAHEIARVYLAAKHEPLADSESAADLAAMMLGFDEILAGTFITMCPEKLQEVSGFTGETLSRFKIFVKGKAAEIYAFEKKRVAARYLSAEEVMYAQEVIRGIRGKEQKGSGG